MAPRERADDRQVQDALRRGWSQVREFEPRLDDPMPSGRFAGRHPLFKKTCAPNPTPMDGPHQPSCHSQLFSKLADRPGAVFTISMSQPCRSTCSGYSSVWWLLHRQFLFTREDGPTALLIGRLVRSFLPRAWSSLQRLHARSQGCLCYHRRWTVASHYLLWGWTRLLKSSDILQSMRRWPTGFRHSSLCVWPSSGMGLLQVGSQKPGIPPLSSTPSIGRMFLVATISVGLPCESMLGGMVRGWGSACDPSPRAALLRFPDRPQAI